MYVIRVPYSQKKTLGALNNKKLKSTVSRSLDKAHIWHKQWRTKKQSQRTLENGHLRACVCHQYMHEETPKYVSVPLSPFWASLRRQRLFRQTTASAVQEPHTGTHTLPTPAITASNDRRVAISIQVKTTGQRTLTK